VSENALFAAGLTIAAYQQKEVVPLPVRTSPSNWQRVLILKDGSQVFARPIRSDDAPKILLLLQSVNREDLRLRFFDSIKEFSQEFISKLTQIDHSRAMAFVASDELESDIVGVVRLHSTPSMKMASLRFCSNRIERAGGWALMQLIIEYARSEALKFISGQILHENTVMLNMSRELGFDIKVDSTELDIYNVTLALAGGKRL
jgi:acetyltransferase